ncbi:MAG: DUF502 domain-containing protein [Candidatus Omnitrophica bacterium]|nr:DUF502 domain-containing protein [Candidatus Omnitrophota bacterium]
MKKFMGHLRKYVFRGLWAIIPLYLSYMAVKLCYVLIDKKVMSLLDRFVDIRQIPGLGILLVLIFLYLIGLIVSNFMGKQLFHFIEWISQRIPIVNSVYQVGKQLSKSFSGEGKEQSFKKVLLARWSGVWAIVFVAGKIEDKQTGKTLLRVFMPHVPNPAAGFIFLVEEKDTIDPGWTNEEAIKMVVSASVIAPEQIQELKKNPQVMGI